MSVEETLIGLSLLAYEATNKGRPNTEKLLHSAVQALKAGQAMRDAHRTAKQYDYHVAADAWDAATKEQK